jgi:broad specificity phosphatase PhoE
LQGERDAVLDESSRPGAELTRLTRDALIISSPLRRALESAQLLSPNAAPEIATELREAELPCAFRANVRLPPGVWTGLARSAWFCGWSAGVESFRIARQRAKRAAHMLHALANQHVAVVAVGHGLMNALIGRQLRALGWRGPQFPSRAHWEFGGYWQ